MGGQVSLVHQWVEYFHKVKKAEKTAESEEEDEEEEEVVVVDCDAEPEVEVIF